MIAPYFSSGSARVFPLTPRLIDDIFKTPLAATDTLKYIREQGIRVMLGEIVIHAGGHNSTALVGTPDHVSDALLKYDQLGIESVLIRGFDPLNEHNRRSA